MRSLLDCDKFEIVGKEMIRADESEYLCVFAFTMKANDSQGKHKARFDIAGHYDYMKKLIVHQAQNTQLSTTCLIPALAAMYSCNAWTSNMRQAYLFSEVAMSRPGYIKLYQS